MPPFSVVPPLLSRAPVEARVPAPVLLVRLKSCFHKRDATPRLYFQTTHSLSLSSSPQNWLLPPRLSQKLLRFPNAPRHCSFQVHPPLWLKAFGKHPPTHTHTPWGPPFLGMHPTPQQHRVLIFTLPGLGSVSLISSASSSHTLNTGICLPWGLCLYPQVPSVIYPLSPQLKV